MLYPIILQEQKNDCATACLAMLIKYYHKKNVILATLKQEAGSNWESWNIKTLIIMASNYGVLLTAYHCCFEDLQKITITNPCILYINNDLGETHFVVVYKKRHQKFLVADSNKTHLQWLTRSHLQSIYLGTLIVSAKKNILSNNKILKRNQSLFSLLKPYKFKLLFLLGTNFLLTLINLLANMLVKVFVDNHQIFRFYDIWFKILLGFIIIIITKIIISFCQAKLILLLSNDFMESLVERYHNALNESKLIVYEQYQDSDWWQLIIDLNTVGNLMMNRFLTIIHTFVMGVGSLILLFMIHWGFVILILLQSLILLIISSLFYRLSYYEQIREKNQTLLYYQQYFEFVQSPLQRLGNDLNPILIKKMQLSYENLQKIQSNLFNQNNKITHYEQIVISFSNFLILYFSSWLLLNNNFSLGQIMFISSLTIYITSFFQEIGQLIMTRKKLLQSINRIKPFLFLSQKKTINNHYFDLIRTIRLNEVSFCYQKLLVLNQINYQFQQTNFVTGISGSGKSTLLHLIAGLQPNYQGTIQLNDTNLQTVSTKQLICYLPQRPYLYDGSILDNIINFDYTITNLKKIKQLNINEILAILNLNLAIKCFNNGQNLSSGQRQVIAFLKIFFHHCWKIILIDEALSNVDGILKEQLVELLLSNFDKAIIIFVSHDLTLKKYFHFHSILTKSGLIKNETSSL